MSNIEKAFLMIDIAEDDREKLLILVAGEPI